ncbi:hypothetical protein [Burkholderia glumae]|uniref:hypothetical protein n=1 Tax=Burkholderia glumae TaxID=337 RepID=UPI0020B1F5DD|nr:hypothetical protein [Burkholderia glumae]
MLDASFSRPENAELVWLADMPVDVSVPTDFSMALCEDNANPKLLCVSARVMSPLSKFVNDEPVPCSMVVEAHAYAAKALEEAGAVRRSSRTASGLGPPGTGGRSWDPG